MLAPLESFLSQNDFDVNFLLPYGYNRRGGFLSHMEKIQIAVGSTRRPKLAAVSEAIQDFGAVLAPGMEFEVFGVEVGSGVGHTPTNRAELMQGARQRAEALVRLARQKNEEWRYFVGLEGGLDVIQEGASRRVLLESWAYVSDGRKGHYGRSGGIEIPDALAHEVLENGVELSEAIDRFAGAVGIRDAQGAWGYFTNNLVTRQDASKLAVVTAFAPFLRQSVVTTNQRVRSDATRAAKRATTNPP